VKWPDDCKDANDTLLKYGIEGVNGCLDAAAEVAISGIFAVDNIRDKVMTLYHQGLERGLTTGFQSLDPHFTLKTGQWTVFTGAPGSGKSQFVDALILNSAQLHGWKWGICSIENQPIEGHLARLTNMLTGKPVFPGPNQRQTEPEINAAMDWLAEKVFFILPGETLELDEILRLAAIQVRRKGINGLVIDPWNELDHNFRGITETQYISREISKIRRFARSHNLHIIVVAHPTKLKRDETNGTYLVPTLYDIAGSANWYNKADNGIAVWRENPTVSEVEVWVQKIRFQDTIGVPGMARLSFDRITKRYSDPFGFDALDGVADNEVPF
jgi:twinkle protein